MKRSKKTDSRLCQWCWEAGIPRKATWKDNGQYACNEHKSKIHVDDWYMTEADYQTWGRWGRL